MNVKIAGILTAVLAIVIPLLEYTISAFTNALQQGGGGVHWFPHLETTGQTIQFYSMASQTITFLLAVPMITVLGFMLGKNLDVGQDYSLVISIFAVGGAVGNLFWLLAIGLINGSSNLFIVQSWFALAVGLGTVAATSLQFALLGLAGAAPAEFGLEFYGQQVEDMSSNAEVKSNPD
ncbi:hypothetical protein [Haloparvum sp. PAK95]|uniref:hypothetical protein n=1 Tax=Haloparvum sp. PAK95 TaxID=3418962 RepID=UPI003D2F0BE1